MRVLSVVPSASASYKTTHGIIVCLHVGMDGWVDGECHEHLPTNSEHIHYYYYPLQHGNAMKRNIWNTFSVSVYLAVDIFCGLLNLPLFTRALKLPRRSSNDWYTIPYMYDVAIFAHAANKCFCTEFRMGAHTHRHEIEQKRYIPAKWIISLPPHCLLHTWMTLKKTLIAATLTDDELMPE